MAVPVPFLQYTPIRARTGKLVHAITLQEPTETACGRKCAGWVVALIKVNCTDCQKMVFFPVKRRRRKVK